MNKNIRVLKFLISLYILSNNFILSSEINYDIKPKTERVFTLEFEKKIDGNIFLNNLLTDEPTFLLISKSILDNKYTTTIKCQKKIGEIKSLIYNLQQWIDVDAKIEFERS